MPTTYYMDYVNGNDANNGSTWALAKKGFPALKAVMVAGDTARIAKSPAPTSVGQNATWNQYSKTVTLTSAVTSTVSLCEAGWTQGASVTATYDATTYKQGSTSLKLVTGALGGAQELAYIDLGAQQDYSAYQQISFWFRNQTTALTAGDLKIKFYSDAARTVEVNSMNFPAIPFAGAYWMPLTLNNGAAFSGTVRCVSIYANVALASKTYYFDDFICCKDATAVDSITLQSLISKESTEHGMTEGWYGIQSIDNTTILLDNGPNTLASAGRGYEGNTESVPLYKRETIKFLAAASLGEALNVTFLAGTETARFTLSGGWNTATTIQDGETIFDCLSQYTYGIYMSVSGTKYLTIERISCYRAEAGIYWESDSSYGCKIIDCLGFNNNNWGAYFSFDPYACVVDVGTFNNNIKAGININGALAGSTLKFKSVSNNIGTAANGAGINSTQSTARYIDIYGGMVKNNQTYGLCIAGNIRQLFHNITTANNGTAGVFCYSGWGCEYMFRDCVFQEATEITSIALDLSDGGIFSQNHDGTEGYCKILYSGGQITSQNTTRHTASGIAWTLSPTHSTRGSSLRPLQLKVATVWCVANNTYNISAWIQRDNAEIAGRLFIRGGQLVGIPTDVYSSVSAVGSWEEVTLPAITPTANGPIDIYCQAYGGTTRNVYIDDISITGGNISNLGTMDYFVNAQPLVVNVSGGSAAVTVGFPFIG